MTVSQSDSRTAVSNASGPWSPSGIGYHGNARFKFQALLCQALDLSTCCQRHHLKALGMRPNHIQGIDAD
jgi:hypothetical protein